MGFWCKYNPQNKRKKLNFIIILQVLSAYIQMFQKSAYLNKWDYLWTWIADRIYVMYSTWSEVEANFQKY